MSSLLNPGDLLLFAIGLGTAINLILAVFLERISRRLPSLESFDAPVPEAYPKLSVIIPACNEESTIEAALSTILSEDYPELEIVLIDDRSTDRTGEIMQRMAAKDPRIKVVRIEALPSGWLGKLNALRRGVERATGDWFLFTDADVHYRRGMMAQTVRLALANDLDLMSVVPSFRAHGLLLRAMILSFGSAFLMAVRPDRVQHGSTKYFAGVGAFNLVRRTKFEESVGFDGLKMEVADDVGLGLILHQAGARAAFYAAGDRLEIEWYGTLSAMQRGLEKNLFGISMRWRFTRLLIQAPLFLFGFLSPFVASFQGQSDALALFGLVTVVVVLSASAIASHRMRLGWLAGLVAPAGSALVFWTLLRSTYFTMKRGGISWRGTFYDLRSLREGQRLRL